MKKFIKTIDVQNYEVLTDTGWENVEKLHKTIEYEIYEIHLENGYILKCADEHILFNGKSEEIFVKDIFPGDVICTDIGNSEVLSVVKTGKFENMYDLELNEGSNRRYYTNGILSHNTQLASQIAEFIFGDKDAIIRVDMSEYMEKFNSSKLIGAPPGYVGHEEGGQLTEKVRRKPYSVVLFDEIEKAHPDIFNTMLQILDEGMITDGLGRKINFKNCLIILTSNVGQRKAAEFGGGIGFGSKKTEVVERETKNTIRKELEKTFPPEFINRLDEIIYFNHLSQEDIIKIIDIEIKKMTPRFESIGYKLVISKDLKEKFAERGYDPKYGARPLRRILQKYVEDTVAELVITRKIKEGDKVTLSLDTKKDSETEIPIRVKITSKKSE
jgi:hypothetical protein